MTMRLAGVALAAVMACGWAGGARAAPIYFDLYSKPPQNGGAHINIVLDKDDPSANSFSYSYFREDNFFPVLPGFGETTSEGTDKNADITATFQGPGYGVELFFLISVLDPNYTYRTYYKGTNEDTGQPIDTYIDTTGLSFQFQLVIDKTNYQNYGFGSGTVVSGTITGDLASLAPVPLPASAPLFGLALAGLGVLRLGRKRSTKVSSM